jgi:hypothetical protein
VANTQEQSLTATTTLALTDFVRVVSDPTGTPVSKVMTLANFQAAIRSLVGLTDMMIAPYQVRTTATFSKTSDVTLANITGLSVTLEAGKNYLIEAQIPVSASASGGSKCALGGTVTAGLIIYDGILYAHDVIHQERATALGGAVAATTAASTPITLIHGFISVSVGGTLTVQFAQNASHATPSVVQIGASLCVKNIT